MVLAGNKAKRLSSVNLSANTIHQQQQHHYHHHFHLKLPNFVIQHYFTFAWVISHANGIFKIKTDLRIHNEHFPFQFLIRFT